MTLIECFTASHMDNMGACLRLRPEKMIMVGDGKQMGMPVKRYRKILEQRGLRTEISLCDVGGMDLQDICSVLDKVIKTEGQCVIDLTGGDTLVVMAVGAVLAGLDGDARQQIRVEKYDHRTETVLDCVHDNARLPYKPVHLSVEELIALHGGALYPNEYQPPETCSSRAIDRLWRLASEEPKEWNRKIMVLNEFESRADSRTQVYLPLSYLRSSIAKFEEKEATVRELLGKFEACGVVEDHSSQDVLEYTYTSPLLRYCTLKSGNILEIKTLLEGRSVLRGGAPFFGDCRMSVSIDWDSVLHTPEEHKADTRNEIDVILMHGMTPLFISCKHGNVEEEELYKLNTVAERFGGPYAKKMLIATELDKKSPSADRSFVQRAWDMDIFLVTDARKLTNGEWKNVLLQAMQ